MAKMRSNNSGIGTPLTPSLLADMQAISDVPPTPQGFSAEGNWTHSYRIWCFHGEEAENANSNVGALRLTRSAGSAGRFTLEIEEKILNMDDVLNVVQATVECQADRLGTPVKWGLSNRVIGANGQVQTRLSLAEQGIVSPDHLDVIAGGRTFRREGTAHLAFDWGLFEALGRLDPASKDFPLTFDVMEGLISLRPGHRLEYRGVYPLTLGNSQVSLHWYDQIGHGLLPYEYWVDDARWLVVAVAGSRAYILDDNAVAAMNKREGGGGSGRRGQKGNK